MDLGCRVSVERWRQKREGERARDGARGGKRGRDGEREG